MKGATKATTAATIGILAVLAIGISTPADALQIGSLELITEAVDGGASDGESIGSALSSDGQYVAFSSSATNLVAGDTNDESDVFVRDTVTGITTRVSVATDSTEADDTSSAAAISSDGRYVTFYSEATNLVAGDTNGEPDVFVRDTFAATTTRVSIASDGSQADGTFPSSFYPAISGDGRYITFASYASNLVAGDTNGCSDVFVRDTVAGTTTRVSVTTAGTEASGGDSTYSAISSDGVYITFSSRATNLVVGDTNGYSDVFVRNTATDLTQRISKATGGAQADGHSDFPVLSSNGRYIVYSSAATNLVTGDTNGFTDVFVGDNL